MDARGAKPLKDLLQSGGDNLFPTLSPGWTEAGLSFSELVERITAVGGLNSAPFISVQVAVDIRESTSAIIKIDQQYTLLAPLLYLNARTSTVLSKYQDVYAQILTLLGANETVARDDAVDVVNFETEIAKILESPHSRANETAIYIKMTIGNLTERYPQFDWYGHLETLFAEANVSITEDEVVVNTALGYFDKLFDLVSSTPERTLLNYGMWRITWPLVGLTSKQLRDAKGSFIRLQNNPRVDVLLCITSVDQRTGSMQGTTRSPSRREQCVEVTMKYFPYSVGRLYIERKNFTQRARNRLEEMAANLLEAFKEIVRESDWMSNSTKQAALEKADSMKYKIGYPDFIMNDTWLDERLLFRKTHSSRTASTYSYKIASGTWKRYENLLMIRGGRFPLPLPVQATFPQGMKLRNKLRSDRVPDWSRNHARNGNLATWWQPEDVQKFVQRAQCMLDQYANFTDPALDTKAYRRTVTERGKEEARLPVIPYTPDQLFFVGFAQIWCGNYRDKYRAVLLHMDVHSPHRFRVLGALQNNPDFARVFDCPTGSPMNPGRKCHVW
ncbi:hypothetical protein BaRGS_00038100 [Batillaria attramentaria]|uniref:Uncharacterized protein n=1 Tax=Batillaria attramentaria TaxID=370345 RepID=A0ABD0J6V7_9CAEN